MKLTVNKADLLRETQKCAPFVARKTTIPILANFLLRATGQTLDIIGTDLDNALTVCVSAAIQTEGTCTIPAHKFVEILKKLKTLESSEVSIEAFITPGKEKSPDTHHTVISCGEFKVKLSGMAPKSYPVIEPFPMSGEVIPVNGETLTGLFSRTSYAIAKEESRYTLNGALLVIQPDSIRMVTTDGHRLANVTLPGTYPVATQLRTLINRVALTLVSKLIDSQDVEITKTETHIFFRAANWTMVTRHMPGQFPNYEAVMPKENIHEAVLMSADLRATLDRISMFADERSRAVKFEFVPNHGLRLSASSSDFGDASEAVKSEYAGDPISMGFDARYVLEFLNTLAKDECVKIKTKRGDSAALFVPLLDGGYDNQAVLMPVRL